MKRCLVVFLLAGCAATGYRFTHPTKSAQDYEKDRYECGLIVRQVVSQARTHNNPLVEGPMATREFAACMKHRYGWDRVSCQPGTVGCGLYME
jgi:hypothetical protein